MSHREGGAVSCVALDSRRVITGSTSPLPVVAVKSTNPQGISRRVGEAVLRAQTNGLALSRRQQGQDESK
jgi:hypothetical protein